MFPTNLSGSFYGFPMSSKSQAQTNGRARPWIDINPLDSEHVEKFQQQLPIYWRSCKGYVCQARWKSGALLTRTFLSYNYKRQIENSLCVFAGKMYLTIYVECAKDHFVF